MENIRITKYKEICNCLKDVKTGELFYVTPDQAKEKFNIDFKNGQLYLVKVKEKEIFGIVEVSPEVVRNIFFENHLREGGL